MGRQRPPPRPARARCCYMLAAALGGCSSRKRDTSRTSVAQMPKSSPTAGMASCDQEGGAGVLEQPDTLENVWNLRDFCVECSAVQPGWQPARAARNEALGTRPLSGRLRCAQGGCSGAQHPSARRQPTRSTCSRRWASGSWWTCARRTRRSTSRQTRFLAGGPTTATPAACCSARWGGPAALVQHAQLARQLSWARRCTPAAAAAAACCAAGQEPGQHARRRAQVCAAPGVPHREVGAARCAGSQPVRHSRPRSSPAGAAPPPGPAAGQQPQSLA